MEPVAPLLLLLLLPWGGWGSIPANRPPLGYLTLEKHSSSLLPSCWLWSFGG